MSEEKTIQSQIKDDLIKARIAKSKMGDINASTNVETLTLLKASLQNKEIAKQSDLTNAETISVIRSQVKQLNQTLDSAKTANRQELIAKTKHQIKLLSVYLPQLLNESQILEYLTQNYSQNITFGQAMGKLMKELSGKIDGVTAKAAIQQFLR